MSELCVAFVAGLQATKTQDGTLLEQVVHRLPDNLAEPIANQRQMRCNYHRETV